MQHSLGQRLRLERERLGYNVRDFAALGCVSRSAQSRYERNEAKPSSEYFKKIKADEPEFEMLWVMFGADEDEVLRDTSQPKIPVHVRQLVRDYELCNEAIQKAIRQMAKSGADARHELVKRYRQERSEQVV